MESRVSHTRLAQHGGGRAVLDVGEGLQLGKGKVRECVRHQGARHLGREAAPPGGPRPM